ncbi:hypothetical protein B0T16DRAFT_67459 [Cercophora newfieldiana]|uniref:Uncharacterized protein n=1 Tax=Cercophora newfieldiana TaxID=92897 RepID=A0AA40D0X4_9PEZI|nr:hypothetical protein B0T16DRAFT_67459 [Cercophora newfieldiana]
METQSRLRPPSLQTGWPEREKLDQFQFPKASHSARHSAHSPGPYSPSLRSPSFPSPLYPRSPGYDHSMRRHERAMVDSFDPRARRASQDGRSPHRSLSPIAEANWHRRRSSFITSPATPHAPAPTPVTGPPVSHGLSLWRPRNQTLAAETRSILLAGTPQAAQTLSPSPASERRRSLPPRMPSGRRSSLQERQQLQAWGKVFLGDTTEASCFVSAVSVRRPSEPSSGGEAPTPTAPGKQAEPGNQVTIRAKIWPFDQTRKPYVIKRVFDMDELRATIQLPPSSPNPTDPRKPSNDLRADSPSRSRRFSSEPGASVSSVGTPANTAPIHIRYACAYLPVLAALIYSGHVKDPRDIIDLPMPHPQVWKRTVAYVYTGQGELTDAIKQNILYLGGKV